MKTKDFARFVMRTDQYAIKTPAQRHAIALYGLVGEIGSLVSAVKKKLLAEGGAALWDEPNEEIKEELGDVLWYCYSLAQITNETPFDVLASDIATLAREIGGKSERAEKIRAALETLDPEATAQFLEAAAAFPPVDGYSFDDYQRLAFKTARTEKRILLEVCLAVLWQLGAELLRATLPEIELTINRNVADRPSNIVLGEITWHLAAIASLYHLSLDDVVSFNYNKVGFRAERGEPTALHDQGRKPSEQFPREFDVQFVRISPRKSRMYFNGKRLGDDLTDNAYDDDGYRFHDVIHLALIAHLGWSPVVRDFMKHKRKSLDDGVDEVEDGGRAKVVEELVIKAIHSEGERQAQEVGRCAVGGPTRLFPERSVIPFRLLKTINVYVADLEVERNHHWEWENAIFDGCAIFQQLRTEKQGTVRLNLDKRTLAFSPTVAPEIRGVTVGLGMGTCSSQPTEALVQQWLTASEVAIGVEDNSLAKLIAAKQALAQGLGLSFVNAPLREELQITILPNGHISLKPAGSVLEEVWRRRAVDYRVAFTEAADQTVCTAVVMADPNDLAK